MVWTRSAYWAAMLLGVAGAGGFAAGCTAPCQQEVGPPVTHDFSSLRLQGEYKCDAVADCAVRFESATRAILTIADAAAGDTEITYDIAYPTTREQRQKVLASVSLGGQQPDKACGTTQGYRWETWTVPATMFMAVSARRNGQPLELTTSARVLHLPASTFASLVVQTHYVDRSKADEYVGVLTQNASFPSWTMAITRSGARFFIGPA